MPLVEATISNSDIVIERIGKLSGTLRQALADAMKRQWFRIQAATVTEKLSGDPLHRRTGVLASSINVGGTDSATSFEDGATEIVGRIGTKVRYGAVHENGGEFEIKAHERKVTGRLHGEHTVAVKAHTAKFPQRSFLRSTLNELRPSVIDAIREAVAKAAAQANG